MLHVFFFVMTYLTDYHTASEILRGGFLFGLVNASLVCFVVGCGAIRGWFVKRSRAASDIARVQ